MYTIKSRALLCSILLPAILAMSVVIATMTYAHDYTVGSIDIIHPWAHASAGPAKSGAVYLMLSNGADEPDRLISVSTPAAKKAALHTMVMEGDVMKMRPLKFMDIPPGDSAELAPGAAHIMLMGLTERLDEGKMFPLTLTFEKAGSIEVMVKIVKIGDMESMDGMDMGN